VILEDPRFRITEATHDDERETVYRFRYQLYVEEMKRFQQYADHDFKRVCEPLDTSGHILAAYNREDKLVGTVRYNVGVDENFGIYTELYPLRQFIPFFPNSVSITTKLMVALSYRRSSLAFQLAMACYKNGLELGTCFDFIDCNPPLLGFFTHLGYWQTASSVRHAEYGDVIPLVLAMHDVQHLEKVGSPFARIGYQFEDKHHSVKFFRDLRLASGHSSSWSGGSLEMEKKCEYNNNRL
jgi:hypothetical protein